MFTPSYIELTRTGELNRRAEALQEILMDCTLCPHECRVNRISGDSGECEAPGEVYVSSAFPHFGEEPPLVGLRGSGTIFLTHCSLKCVFCQNDSISRYADGRRVDLHDLANEMIALQQMGCHNINFVTPTHYVPQIVSAVALAVENGLSLPLVYNTSGYDSVKTLKLLDGIIDIYMPDTKFALNAVGRRYTLAEDYSESLFAALKEMHRQVGDLQISSLGIAERGMLIRHLVMPNDEAGTETVMKFVAKELGKDSYVNIMDQYRPMCHAKDFPEINRRITVDEWNNAVGAAGEAGLHRGF